MHTVAEEVIAQQAIGLHPYAVDTIAVDTFAVDTIAELLPFAVDTIAELLLHPSVAFAVGRLHRGALAVETHHQDRAKGPAIVIINGPANQDRATRPANRDRAKGPANQDRSKAQEISV